MRTPCLTARGAKWRTSCVQSEKMPHAQPALHSRRAQQFTEARLEDSHRHSWRARAVSFSLAKGEFNSGGHGSAGEPMEKMPHRGSVQDRASLRSAGLEPVLSGIRGSISTSRSHRSGPVELQWSRERLLRQTQRQGDMISTSHRPGPGLEPIHLLLSWRVRGLQKRKHSQM